MRFDRALGEDDDLVGDGEDALLMGDYHYRAALDALSQLLEDLDETAEAPEVDARLRLVEDRERRAAHEHGRDLDALEFAAGERRVDLALDVIARAQPDSREVVARFDGGDGLARRDAKQVDDAYALEAHRLLEREADAHLGAVGYALFGYVLAVQDDAPRRGLFDTRDYAGERRFAAAVRSGDDDELVVRHRQTDVAHYGFILALRGHLEGDVFQFEHMESPFSAALSGASHSAAE